MKKILINLSFALVTILYLFAEIIFFFLWYIWKNMPAYLNKNYRAILTILPQWVRAEINQYDINGYYHNVKHLDEMTKTIRHRAIKAQVKYADRATRKSVDKNTIDVNNGLAQLKTIKGGKVNAAALNTTSIGNIAYIAANCKNETLAKEAYRVLNILKSA